MLIELHILQNFAPSCLNRDDNNTPKDCEFGGHRRARVSSQCIKRSIRRYFTEQHLLPEEHLAERTKRLIAEVVKVLSARGRDETKAACLVKATLASVKLAADEANKTQYLLFLGRREVVSLAGLVDQRWDALAAVPAAEESSDKEDVGKEMKTAKQKKAEAAARQPLGLARQVREILQDNKAADVALFGRMLADLPVLGVDAACQVAHALSTNKVSMEMDFFTAIDDLKPREEFGASMLDITEFNSACFYRYVNLNLEQLRSNLQNDAGLTLQTAQAFLTAAIHAIPTGKQNTFAAHNPPSLVLAVVRSSGLYSLANAFENPIRPDHKGSLVQNSVAAIDSYWGRLTRVYGSAGLLDAAVCKVDDWPELQALKGYEVETLGVLLDRVMAKVANNREDVP